MSREEEPSLNTWDAMNIKTHRSVGRGDRPTWDRRCRRHGELHGDQ